MKIKSENSEVFYITDSNPIIKKKDFDRLIDLALTNSKNRARYCAHKNKENNLHEMFIALSASAYIRPFKHEKKSTSFHIISGELDLYFFNDSGELKELVSLSDFQSGKPFYFCAPENTFRISVPISKIALYHEVTMGPFRKEDIIVAPWSPPEEDKDAVQLFLSHLSEMKAKL